MHVFSNWVKKSLNNIFLKKKTLTRDMTHHFDRGKLPKLKLIPTQAINSYNMTSFLWNINSCFRDIKTKVQDKIVDTFKNENFVLQGLLLQMVYLLLPNFCHPNGYNLLLSKKWIHVDEWQPDLRSDTPTEWCSARNWNANEFPYV